MYIPTILPIPAHMLSHSVVFDRDGVAQSAQKVCLYWLRQLVVDKAGRSGDQAMITRPRLIGNATLDVKIGDQFAVDSRKFEVVYVQPSEQGVMTVVECEAYG